MANVQNYFHVLEIYRILEGFQEGKVCLEDILGQPTDHDDQYEDADIMTNVNKFSKLLVPIFNSKNGKEQF